MRDKDGKPLVHVLEALYKGCEACGTACPTRTVTMGYFTTEGVIVQIEAALFEAKA